jgi:hypothetical protein
MHFPPGDSIEAKFSNLTTFTNQDTGWLTTGWAEKNESGKYDLIRKIYRTEDGGNNWMVKFTDKQKLVVEYAQAYSIYSMEPDYFIAMYNDSVAGALISEDGGKTWINRRITDEHLSYRVSKIHFFDDLNGIAFNNNRWFTSDGGYTWEKSNDSFENRNPTDVCFVNDSLGWMVSGGNKYATDSGYLANTTDGGKTWKYQDSIAVMLSGVDFIDSLKGFAVGTNFTFSTAFIYSTTDGGEHWNLQQFGGEGYYRKVGFLDDRFGWIIKYGTILRTADGGQTWEVQLDDLNCVLEKLIILKEDKVAYIFGSVDNYTLKLYRADLNTLAVTSEKENIPDKFYITQNYPNPFNLRTTINYSINQKSSIELKVYNIRGEEVCTLLEETQNPGSYQISWNGKNDTGEDFASGIYIYRLTVNNKTVSRKLVLLK